MLRHPGYDSSRRPIARCVVAASFLLLVGCESNMPAPTTPRPGAPSVVSSTRDGAEGARPIVGTGDPAIDVPNVQAAVDRGGVVLLQGHFSFDAPPNPKNTLAAGLLSPVLPPAAEVKITRAVTVLGVGDADNEMATIDGGTIPFYVEAPNEAVTIRRLRFIRPISHAVLVFAVRGLEIASTKLEGLRTYKPNLNGAISVITLAGIPMPANPGMPSNVSGRITIANNDFDLTGGTTADNVLGVTVFSVGDTAAPVEVRVARNRIRNTTEPAINFRRAVGHVFIEHNVLAPGTIGVTGARDEVIRVANLGSYVVAHNTIDCEWPLTDATGIAVFSQLQAWPMKHALVFDNDVTITAPSGMTLTDFHAGIAVFGWADSNVVRQNRIHGTARSGIAVPFFAQQAAASPTDNVLARNHFDAFTPEVADYLIGQTAVGTRIIGPGTYVDQGQGTIIEQKAHSHQK